MLCSGIDARELAEAPGFFHCPDCDVRFRARATRLTRGEEAHRYRQHNNDVHDPRYREFLTPLADLIVPKLRAGAHGLDFGCGPGPLLADIFRERGFRMDVYDPEFFPQKPSDGASFDFIVTTEVIEHLFDPLQEFRRLHHWLKPGGWLGVMTAFVEPPVDFASWYYRRDPTHVVFFSHQSLAWLAKASGFDSTQIIYEGPRLALLLAR